MKMTFCNRKLEPPIRGARCQLLGPGPASQYFSWQRFWDKVALTEEESRAVDALNLIYS